MSVTYVAVEGRRRLEIAWTKVIMLCKNLHQKCLKHTVDRTHSEEVCMASDCMRAALHFINVHPISSSGKMLPMCCDAFRASIHVRIHKADLYLVDYTKWGPLASVNGPHYATASCSLIMGHASCDLSILQRTALILVLVVVRFCFGPRGF